MTIVDGRRIYIGIIIFRKKTNNVKKEIYYFRKNKKESCFWVVMISGVI